MGKKIEFPAKITIMFSKDKDGNVDINKFMVKYKASIEEYPNFPGAIMSNDITLTTDQEKQIKSFCKSVILPQI